MRPTDKVRIFCLNHKIDLFIIAVATIFFAFMYLVSPFSPHLSQDGGWMSYFDQGAYLRQAKEMAGLQLGKEYLYGIAYPLTAVPFIWLGINGGNAFLFFNLVAFVGAVWALYRFMSTLVGQNLAIVSGFALMFATPLIDYTVQPWNSTVCLFSMATILYVASLRGKKLNNWMILAIATASAMAFAARYVDAVWIWAMGVILLLCWSAGWRKIILMTGITAVLCLPVFYTHWRVYGSPLTTPYIRHTGLTDNTTDQDLSSYSISKIPEKFVGMFISPKLAGVDESRLGFFAVSFWLLFAFALPLFLKGRPQKDRWLLIGFYLVMLGHLFFYLAHRGGGGGAIKYGELHYYKMLWPLMAAFAVLVMSKIVSTITDNKSKASN